MYDQQTSGPARERGPELQEILTTFNDQMGRFEKAVMVLGEFPDKLQLLPPSPEVSKSMPSEPFREMGEGLIADLTRNLRAMKQGIDRIEAINSRLAKLI